jgi:hypothetical protein
MRLQSQLTQPICPRHKCAKTRKGKLSRTGVWLYYCAQCVDARDRQGADDRREAQYAKDPREIAAFRRIDAYLAEQAEALRIRRQVAASSYQSPLGHVSRNAAFCRPKGVRRTS